MSSLYASRIPVRFSMTWNRQGIFGKNCWFRSENLFSVLVRYEIRHEHNESAKH